MAEDSVAYIALDPGETTGWAKFNDVGEVIAYGQYTQAEQTGWLTKNITDLKAVIIEDYRNYSWEKQKRWSRNQTSKNIGGIEMICEMRKIPYFLQPANIKSIGYKWAGLGAAPTNHSISHQFDAVAHGVYWLTIKNIRSAVLNNPEGQL
jgi:hypothetical protein